MLPVRSAVVPLIVIAVFTPSVVALSGADCGWPCASSSVYDRVIVSPFDVTVGQVKLCVDDE